MGLIAADLCFSAICNEDRFHRKTKAGSLLAEFREGVLQSARRSLAAWWEQQR